MNSQWHELYWMSFPSCNFLLFSGLTFLLPHRGNLHQTSASRQTSPLPAHPMSATTSVWIPCSSLQQFWPLIQVPSWASFTLHPNDQIITFHLSLTGEYGSPSATLMLWLNLSEPPFPQTQNSISVPLQSAFWCLMNPVLAQKMLLSRMRTLNSNNKQLSLQTTPISEAQNFKTSWLIFQLSPMYFTLKTLWFLLNGWCHPSWCNSITPHSQLDYFPLCPSPSFLHPETRFCCAWVSGKGPDWNPSSTLHQLLGKASTFSLLSGKMFTGSWDIYLCIFLLNSCFTLAY